ncbi:UNVERIFIED_CONTAM: hypothetical protein PYX00_007641 [Menopon gallinae]|uniref:Spondin domain-containing protein n=1 Tax=Menopon gallinae TaxID=328185 RepID=A0AAW2HL35_9NEOP
MEVLKSVLVLVTISCVCAAEVTPAPSARVTQSCQPDKLTVYRVILHTFWTRDKFPKHYPDWRPSAQWSKLIGESRLLSSLRRNRLAAPGGTGEV